MVGSVTSGDSKGKNRVYPLWPEFSETDVNSEKWVGCYLLCEILLAVIESLF